MYFSESKYYEALETTFNKKGKIHFLKNKIEINYEGDDTLLTYSNDILITKKGETIKTLDLTKNPSVKMFFVLFEAIYFDKKEILQSYFEMKKKGKAVEMLPHKNIAHYIKNVQYKKTNKKLDFLQINLSNEDRIRIEEIE
jgi:hypothetical protein